LEATLTLLCDVQTNGEVTIPAIGWTKDTDTGGLYPLHIDIANEHVREDLAPKLTIDVASLGVASACGLSSAATTMDGTLRVYAMRAPSVPIKAHLALLGVSPYNGKIGGIANSLPVATANSVGGIKGSDSLVIDEDGTAHAILSGDIFASSEEVDAAMDDVFGAQP